MRSLDLGRGLAGALLLLSLLFTAGCSDVVIDPAAAQYFRKSLGSLSVTVYPALIRNGTDRSHDTASSKRIASAFNDLKLGDGIVSETPMPVTGPWRGNKARMLRESAEELGAWVRGHPNGTRYSLLPEYLYRPGGEIGQIHVSVVDWAGKVVFAVLANPTVSKTFHDVDPKTPDEAATVVIRLLEESLVPESKKGAAS